MPWSGSAPNKAFSRNTGTYNGATAWAQTDAAARGIRSDDHDAHDEDMAQGINATWLRDGGNSPSANIPMGGFKLTGLADGTADGDAVNKSQLDAVSGVSLSGTNTFTGSNTFSAGATIGDASGDVVKIKGTTVNSFMSGKLSSTNMTDFMNSLSGAASGTAAFRSGSTWQALSVAGMLAFISNSAEAIGSTTPPGGTSNARVLMKDDNNTTPRWVRLSI